MLFLRDSFDEATYNRVVLPVLLESIDMKKKTGIAHLDYQQARDLSQQLEDVKQLLSCHNRDEIVDLNEMMMQQMSDYSRPTNRLVTEDVSDLMDRANRLTKDTALVVRIAHEKIDRLPLPQSTLYHI